jgi:hypothetical protein
MCMCLHMICIYTYVYIYIYVYVYIRVSPLQLHESIEPLVDFSLYYLLHDFIHIYVNDNIHNIYIYIYIYRMVAWHLYILPGLVNIVQKGVLMHSLCLNSYIYVYMYTYIHIYIYIYTSTTICTIQAVEWG